MINKEAVTLSNRISRKGFNACISRLWPTETIPDTTGSLPRFTQKINEGHPGVLMYRHFSNVDPFIIFSEIVCKNPDLINKNIATAVQKDAIIPGFMTAAKLLHIDIHEVVTNKTTRSVDQSEKLRRIAEDYSKSLPEIVKTLENGGILMLAYSAGKSKKLEEYNGRSVGRLLRALDNEKAENFIDPAFLFMDLRLSGTSGNYEEEKQFDLFKKHELRFGQMLMGSEILRLGENWRNLDNKVIFPAMLEAASR